MPKDKVQTRKKIIAALGRILGRDGMSEIGINAIAREAGVDKVLIYRYFGGLEDLLRAYADDFSIWPTGEELLGEDMNLRRAANAKDIMIRFLQNELKEMRRRKVTQEIMRWELLQSNILTESLANAREKQQMDLLNRLPLRPGQNQDLDLEAILAFFNAGMTYMVLRSRISEKYLGIDLHSNFGWKRLEKVIGVLLNAYI